MTNPIEVTDLIPSNKFKQWHDILVSTGGHYLYNPYKVGHDQIRVSYAPGDYIAMDEAWNRCITPITEVDGTGFWKRVLRKFK